VSGQRESSVNYVMDGIETRNSRWAMVSFRASIDMISEFRIERNAYGGEIGVDGGTIVNITTKGGTNQLHGTAFAFLKNNDLDARNFFDKQRAPLRENDFGVVAGGPVKKDKLFFFASYEGDRNRQGQTLQGLHSSQAQLQGNLADDSNGTGIFPTTSAFCVSNPTSKECKNIGDPTTKVSFSGNIIPANRISYFALKFAQFVPPANALDPVPLSVNRLANSSIVSDWNQWSIRADHNISSRDSAFYRYIWVCKPFFQPGINPGGGSNNPLAGQYFSAGWTRILSPELVGSPQLTFGGNFIGSSLGDFLLGIPSAASGFQSVGTSNWRQNLYAFYTSDSYNVLPNLTLNFGIGWEYKSPIREINNEMAIFDFQTLKLLLAGKDFHGSPVDPFYSGYKPQFGLAWRPFDSNTVIRSGLGIYYESEKSNDLTQGISQNPPFIFKPNFTAGSIPTLSTNTLFPPIDVNVPIPVTVELSTRLKHEKPPYAPGWNFTVEHQFAKDWLLQVAYEGASLNRGGTYEQGNPASYDPTGTIPIQARRLYPAIGDIKIATTGGRGYYHGGTLSGKKRFSIGFSLDAHYTLARSIDDSTNEIDNRDFPLIGRKLDQGPSDVDIRQILVASYIYELPIGKGRRYLNTGGVTNALLGGWLISGITSFMSGPPDKVVLPGNWLNTGTRIFARPNCLADSNDSHFSDNVRSNGLLYFNTAAFQLPALFTPCNCGRNVLRSPGINNWDTSLQKVNRINERFSLQTHVELFNVWNRAQWQIFSSRSGGGYTYGQPGFGNASFRRITAARDPRVIQLAVKLML
jgi:hypothetical protein